MGLRVTTLLAASLLAAAIATSSAQAADPKPDPVDPATCDLENGYVAVALDWMSAWDKATQAGHLNPNDSQKLAVWYVAMENWLLETDDVKGACLALIKARQIHKF